MWWQTRGYQGNGGREFITGMGKSPSPSTKEDPPPPQLTQPCPNPSRPSDDFDDDNLHGDLARTDALIFAKYRQSFF